MQKKRTTLVAAAVAGLALVVGACGSDDSVDTGDDGVTTSLTGTLTTLGDGTPSGSVDDSTGATDMSDDDMTDDSTSTSIAGATTATTGS